MHCHEPATFQTEYVEFCILLYSYTHIHKTNLQLQLFLQTSSTFISHYPGNTIANVQTRPIFSPIKNKSVPRVFLKMTTPMNKWFIDSLLTQVPVLHLSQDDSTNEQSRLYLNPGRKDEFSVQCELSRSSQGDDTNSLNSDGCLRFIKYIFTFFSFVLSWKKNKFLLKYVFLL